MQLSVKELRNIGFGIFHLTRIVADGAKFNSGNHFMKSKPLH